MDASSWGFVELDNSADFLLRDSDAVVDWIGLGTEPLELDFPMMDGHVRCLPKALSISPPV